MIGRNDPCSCGSGKKYKKCCALKSEPTSEKLVNEELERITLGFYDNAIGSPSDIAELERYEREWRSKLGKSMASVDIDMAVAEYFLYVVRRDLWNRYLLKVLNGAIRPATRTVLETWQNPIVLFGKITTVKGDHFLVEQVLGHGTYAVELKQGMLVEEGRLVFGVVLLDNRQRENGIHLLGGLTFIHDQNGLFAQQIESLAETSGQANSYEFFKAHMIDIHKAIAEREINGVDDLVEHELTPEQQKVVEILVDELNKLEAPSQIIELCQMFAITYLIKEKPTFRKPEIIAAAVFKAAYDCQLFGPYAFSQAEIAAMFGVSTSSMKKHMDKVYEIIEETISEMGIAIEN